MSGAHQSLKMNRRDFCSSLTGLAALAAAPSVGILQAPETQAGEVSRVRAAAKARVIACEIPRGWRRSGLIIQRSQGGPGSSVVGDPCVVRDDDIDGWRMFLFFDPPGCGHAVCPQGLDPGPGHWKLEGPLVFTNAQDLMGGSTHKPYVVMDAHRPNHAARIDGHYLLLTVSWQAGHKVVQQSRAERLAGPWRVQPGPLIGHGAAGEFDAKHVDAVTGFHFPERGEILYFYMGYPEQAQTRRLSPLGSAQAVAVQRVGDAHIRKQGEVLPPCQMPGHWASGWVGGLQILPGKTHRWIAIINASPTAPRHDATEVFREEPPPSLGGFASCDEEWPVRGWQWSPQPIEWIQDVLPQAVALGEGTNLWRQHILALPDGRLFLYYNSGFYGREQLYAKIAEGRNTKRR
jgi:hypothetical protein